MLDSGAQLSNNERSVVGAENLKKMLFILSVLISLRSHCWMNTNQAQVWNEGLGSLMSVDMCVTLDVVSC